LDYTLRESVTMCNISAGSDIQESGDKESDEA